jgi:uncharacterized protein (UPF0333 family)
VVRVLGIPAVLVVALIGIYLYTQDAKSNGPTSAAGQEAISQAQSSVAATNFAQADAAMQAYYTQSGTYAGGTLPVGTGVVLVRADAYSYCLQAGDEHENGPGGQPEPGGC